MDKLRNILDSSHDQVGTECLSGGGEMGAYMRQMDWSTTSLGPVKQWPQSLKTSVSICLSSRFPIVLWWGPKLNLIYNDAWRPALGETKHPAIAKPGQEVWSEIWHIIGPQLESVMEKGEATWSEDMLLPMNRHGYLEETYWTYSYSPIRDESGRVGGVFTAVNETTSRYLGERRLHTLREVAEQASSATTAEDACRTAMEKLRLNRIDVPFALIYLVENGGRTARLIESSLTPTTEASAPPLIQLENSNSIVWPFSEVICSGEPVVISDIVEKLGSIDCHSWPLSPTSAITLPLRAAGTNQTAAFLVCGISSGRRFDETYQNFFKLLAGHLATAINNARTLEEQKRRADELAALDRAKTIFFSNISHEFRTPLTLMLGPLEQLLSSEKANLSSHIVENIETIRRNGLRLLRLVNSLLDFARLEAGRLQARYRPRHLEALTEDITSVFRSAIESAGLIFNVHCADLKEPVFVDQDMWEKIVSNLLSNAFKHTFEGEVSVELKRIDEFAELTIRDTGIGIPPQEIPHLFERFRRVEGARGRTHEGSGIGLALVQELVKLHGGTIVVESGEGCGTAFTVRIPLGSAHLPQERLGPESLEAGSVDAAIPFVEEALRWLPNNSRPAGDLCNHPQSNRLRVLLADDNADMRDYVSRLLSPDFDVESVPDGKSALAAAHTRKPDLIITDVMMPVLDGYGVLRELRADPSLSSVPVIMLSARAGQEARVEALQAGADDYLFKPFSSRDLLARVQGLLALSQARSESEEKFREMADNAPVMIRVTDAVGRCMYLNKLWFEFTGADSLSSSELGWINFIDADHLPAIRLSYLEAPNQKQSFHHEYRLRYKDSSYRWVIDTARARYGRSGEFLGYISSIIDIHQRKESETKISELARHLQRRLEELETLLDVIPVGIAISLDQECKRIRVNPAFNQILGLPTPSQISLAATDWDRPSTYKVYDRQGRETNPSELPLQTAAREGKRVEHVELDVVRDDGTTIRLLEYAAPLFNEEGNPRGSVGAFVDITERREAEARRAFVVELDDALRPLSDPDVITATSAQLLGEYLTVDRCAYAEVEEDEDTMLLTGNYLRGTKSIVGRLRFSDFGPEVLRLMRENKPYVVDNIDTHQPAVDVTAYRHTQILAVICVPLHKAGKLVAAMAVHQTYPRRWTETEVSLVLLVANRCWESIERARIARTLKENEEQLRTVLDTSPECVKIVLQGGALEYINAAGLAMTEADSESDVLGRSALTFVAEEHRSEWLSKHQEVIRGRKVNWQFKFIGLKGKMRWIETHSVPLRMPNGSVAQLSVTRDITERKVIEQQHQDLLDSERSARSEAERVNRMKDEFLATLSHELRTPLSAILGWARLLARGVRTPEEYSEGLATIERNAKAQTQLIEDLLDMNRIVSGKIRLEIQPVSLNEVIPLAVKAVEPTLKAKNIDLELRLNPSTATVFGDPNRLQQIVWNFLTNAAKFTPARGGITVTLEQVDTHVAIRVSDTGQGISPDFLPFVFERFRQQDSSTTRQHGGLGLGLSIVKSLVELHGGSVSVESAGVGHGSTFVASLPIALGLPEHSESTPALGRDEVSVQLDQNAISLDSLVILVIEDDSDSRTVLKHILSERGATVVLASSGLEALRLLQTILPSVIISDVGMPEMDGYELIRHIRALPPEQGGRTPAIALTAFARPEDRRRALLSGYQVHVVKPVEPVELITVCSTLTSMDLQDVEVRAN